MNAWSDRQTLRTDELAEQFSSSATELLQKLEVHNTHYSGLSVKMEDGVSAAAASAKQLDDKVAGLRNQVGAQLNEMDDKVAGLRNQSTHLRTAITECE
eukprot:COSAG05_NODE_6394_length_967_cov_52.054409_1_plen_98_part_10